MTIAKGDKLPGANLIEMTADGPASVDIAARVAGKTIVIFGVPGAFTGTCTSAHVPSFMRTKPDFDAKGVDEVICVSVNDPFVMSAWGESTGATAAGLTMLADPAGTFASALGLGFDAPPVGFHGRFKRSAMIVRDGTVTEVQVEDSPGVCNVTAGETLLEAI